MIKKCPFCGNEAHTTRRSNAAYWTVDCDECGARVYDDSEPEAIAAWNRRCGPTLYEGKHYSTVELPEICPDCDGKYWISHGYRAMVCGVCWLTSELDKAETAVATLRDALKAIIATDEDNEGTREANLAKAALESTK